MVRFERFKRPFRHKFIKDEEGVTAVEFAILGPVFFAVLLSMFEIGVTFTKTVLVNNAMSTVSKDIYVGAATAGDITYDQLEQKICDEMIIGGPDCVDNLVLELTEISTITDLPDSEATCEYKDMEIRPAVSYNPGGSSKTVFMRICYVTDILVPGIGYGLKMTQTTGGKYSIVSSTAFINEPF